MSVSCTFGVRPDTQSPVARRIAATAALRQAERDKVHAAEQAEQRRWDEERQRATAELRQRNFRIKMSKFDDLSAYLQNTRTHRILQEVAVKHGLHISQLRLRMRGAHGSGALRVEPYQEACYRLWSEAGLSSPMIGARMGGRDHTTILRAIRAYAERHGLPWRRTREGV